MNEQSSIGPASLKQIEDISKNSRNTWFGLLGALLFAALAVSNVQDSDFFAFGVQTDLPIVNVSVSIVPFFVVGPILVLAIYAYFHLYLTSLWDALGRLPANVCVDGNSVRAEDAVYPWLLSDAALRLKPGSQPKFLSWLKIAVSFSLVWCAGPLVIGLFWIKSWAYHHEWLSLLIAIQVLCSIWIGTMTMIFAIGCMKQSQEPQVILGKTRSQISIICTNLLLIPIGFLLVVLSWNKTEGRLFGIGFTDLYPADLRGAELMPRSGDWIPWETAMMEFLVSYSGKDHIEVARILEDNRARENSADWVESALREFIDRRKSFFGSTGRTNLFGADLRKADLRGAFMSGADLSNSRIGGANFEAAEMEGVTLSNASVSEDGCQEFDIYGEKHYKGCTSFAGASLPMLTIDGGNFVRVNFHGANLMLSEVNGNFQSSGFQFTDMERVKIGEAANFKHTFVLNSDLYRATLLGDFSEATVAGTDIRHAVFIAPPEEEAEFESASAIVDGMGIVSSNLAFAKFPRGMNFSSLHGSYLGNAYIDENAYWSDGVFTGANISDLDVSHLNLGQPDIEWALGNTHTKLPAEKPPLQILKCIPGVAPSSYYFYSSTYLPIAPTLFSETSFCEDSQDDGGNETLMYGPTKERN